MAYRVVIAEDFRMIREIFEETVNRSPEYELEASFPTAVQAMEYKAPVRTEKEKARFRKGLRRASRERRGAGKKNFQRPLRYLLIYTVKYSLKSVRTTIRFYMYVFLQKYQEPFKALL